MPGMLLNAGATVAGAGSPPMTAAPAAPTTATSASGIAFGGGATPVGGGGVASLLTAQFLVPAFFIGFMLLTYHSLPK